ncbi:N-acetyltransferase, GNAT family [Thermococcus kodakarensis KOD1]|uniref:N-acetyltransferase, GNAT family n=1 Tax=Thermococcus kodakarensis (strain ATCC BAA-918 / JCM 12380 / KOD1) TaxID=69014 RepID=Q5JG01_THEKO|nr:GNAT family N-acetyltransferase [Thermococcus kodakarensis]WCN28406.1 GNAT family N-acetyltransferase [Thermococcus kodakarensis]WCN30702.1 GNAT family N-acetyltransferase [Thermococcus kodakarensis]BAD84520.1 N-acetyltransferase, GNAT family [Thermococcus kodakarensis KOD1]
MNLEIRVATLDDVKGIVDVHTAGEELSGFSVRERYLRGGPWMSVETCAVHINALLLEGQYPIVAELDGRIVGEAEVFLSEEQINGEMMRIAHLDVIEVHPDFRGKGIGRAIIEYIEGSFAGKAELLTTQPDEEAIGFYRKLGFHEVLYENWLVEVPTAKSSGDNVRPLKFFPWEKVKGLELVAGRFQSSYDMWFSSFKDIFAGVHELAEAGKVGNSYYVLKPLPGRPRKASLFLWGDEKDIPGAIGRAGEIGFKSVLTVLDEKTANALSTEKKGKVPIIAKRL